MKQSQKLKRLSRADKIELAQRHFEGSKPKSLQKRFRVDESDVDEVIRQFNSGKLFKRHRHWQPHFDSANVVKHPIGKDALRSLESGDGDDPFLSPLDPDLDVANGLLHLTWTREGIDDLLYGILKRCFTILKEGRPSSQEYQEEKEFRDSELFAAICSHLGCDGEELNQTFDYKKRRQSQKH